MLTISQVVPQIAIAPLLVIWLGTEDLPKIIIAFLISFFPMVVSTFTGLTHIEEDLLYLIRGLGASRFQTLAMIRFPNALPHVFAGMKVSVTLAVIGAVVGEFVGSKHGLGYLVIIGTAHGETDLTFGSLFMLGVMGIVLFNMVRISEKLLVPWHVER